MTEKTVLPPVDEMPVLKDAVKDMKLDLAICDRGEVYVFHEKPMPERVNWIEYDREVLKLYFISEKGRIQGIGMTVLDHLDQVISQSKRVYLIHREGGENKSAFEMPLVRMLDK